MLPKMCFSVFDRKSAIHEQNFSLWAPASTKLAYLNDMFKLANSGKNHSSKTKSGSFDVALPTDHDRYHFIAYTSNMVKEASFRRSPYNIWNNRCSCEVPPHHLTLAVVHWVMKFSYSMAAATAGPLLGHHWATAGPLLAAGGHLQASISPVPGEMGFGNSSRSQGLQGELWRHDAKPG